MKEIIFTGKSKEDILKKIINDTEKIKNISGMNVSNFFEKLQNGIYYKPLGDDKIKKSKKIKIESDAFHFFYVLADDNCEIFSIDNYNIYWSLDKNKLKEKSMPKKVKNIEFRYHIKGLNTHCGNCPDCGVINYSMFFRYTRCSMCNQKLDWKENKYEQK